MRAAADLEDRNEKHIVTPGRIVPARELLGEMLLELKQPEAALNEFEASQQREPNRFRNYLGAARDEDYAAGKRAAEKQDWAEAARFFQRAEIRHPDHADLQNSLGFSYRNLKQFELAFKHYRRAIELDPRHRGAHEYIGEAYLLIGDLPGAERHLAALKEICLLPCDELKDLERAIVEYRSRK